MATGYIAPLGKFIAFTNVAPGALAGGKVWTYQAGTSTPTPTWANAALTIYNPNPVILDSAGRATIFIADASVMSYKFVVQDVNGVQVYTEDNISVPAPGTGGGGGTTTIVTVPTGTIIAYGGPAAPTTTSDNGYGVQVFDWMQCDGVSHSRAVTAYQRLFLVIGTTFGSVDGNSFNVPDLRQRFPMGLATFGPAATRGAVGGAFDHTHLGDAHTHTSPAHTHDMTHQHSVPYNGWTTGLSPAPLAGVLQAGGSAIAQEVQATQATTDRSTVALTTSTTGPATITMGNPTAAQTGPSNPPYLVVNYLIKT